MAISLIQSPAQWARVYDTNRLTYIFSSDKYTYPNYNFLIELYMFDPTISGTTDKTLIGTFKQYPLDNGTCEFNPSSVYKNYIKYDLNLSNQSLTDCINSFCEFQIVVYDYYSTSLTTTPSKQGSPYTEPGRGLIYYNGCQMEVPYDYIPLNFLQNNNLQWVMSGVTNGKFLTDATEYRLDGDDIAYLYFLGTHQSLPTKIKYTFYYLNPTGGLIGGSIINQGGLDRLIGLDQNFYNTENFNQSLPKSKPVYSNIIRQLSSDNADPAQDNL